MGTKNSLTCEQCPARVITTTCCGRSGIQLLSFQPLPLPNLQRVRNSSSLKFNQTEGGTSAEGAELEDCCPSGLI